MNKNKMMNLAMGIAVVALSMKITKMKKKKNLV